MSILSFISSIFQPAVDIVDKIHVSDSERLQLKNELASIQEKANSKILDYQAKLAESHTKIVQAEMSSDNKLASSWRPISCLSLVGIVILGSFGYVKVSPELYDLLNVLLGTYSASRGLEKITKTIKLGK